MRDIITISVVNFNADFNDKQKNIKRICEYSEAAAKQGSDLILFPELAVTGYDFFTDKNITKEEKVKQAETISGKATIEISKIASEFNIYIVYGMAEKGTLQIDELYNSAVIIGPEGVIGSYKKTHLFENESLYFTAGQSPFMFSTPWGKISIGICYDTYQFPELMRCYVNEGSRLYLNPTALVEEVTFNNSREAFLDYYKKHLEYGVSCNTIYIASANLTGWDKENYFGGGSCVVGPKITPFFETSTHYYVGDGDDTQEIMSTVTIDLSLATRRLCIANKLTGKTPFNSTLYKTFY